ncbi:MAG: TetR/AcrR family transcriptional regulator [Alphaproteobacteria bacterium]|nr:TetR/AcrR family transcriptional regulator [Alphaproteobacteria bacterium]
MTDKPDGRTERARAAREERRAQILAAALEVFAAKGFHTTSITDLVEAAGVARGTFYLYFDSKDTVFCELLDDLLERFRASVKGIDVASGAASAVDQLVTTVVRILDAAASSQALATIVFKEAVGLDQVVDDRIVSFEEALHDYVRVSLANGVRLGWLRPHDTEVVATLIYGSIRQVIYRYVVVEAGRFDREHVARAMVEHHLLGLIAR